MSVFETLRELVTLEQLAGAKTGEKARCVAPGHEDADPSMHNYGDHVHCFTCGFHGDVVDVWAAARGLEPRIEAALDLARHYSVELPEMDPKARQHARERREKEDLYLKQARTCHHALNRHARVREWWEDRGFGQELRERFLLGANRDGTAAVIPFWSRGRVAGLISRKLKGEPKYLYPKAEDFAGGHRPLFIPGPVRARAFVVEGPLDALAVAAAGKSGVAVGGTDPSKAQIEELGRLPDSICILFDSDKAGREAAGKLVWELYPNALRCPSDYGDGLEDPADLYKARGEEALEVLERLKERATDALRLELDEAPKGINNLDKYRVAKERILPLLTRLEDEGERDAALHDVAGKLKLSIKPLRKALASLAAEDAEPEPETLETEDLAPRPGTDRYERAMEVLQNRRLLSRAAVDMKRLGHVGEFVAKKLALICAVSARSGKPIQPSTHSQSSAGKNFLWDTSLSLLPPEMVVRRSGLSAKALFRTQADLKGAVLYIQEIAGSEDAEYSIRVMQSDGRLEYEATEKMPDGGMKNVVYQTEGPTVVVQTTTKNHLHPENETRVFPIYIDESERQTSRIVGSILKEASGGGLGEAERERLQLKWHDAIRLLEPAEVVIPYAERIEIPSSPLRIRRDAGRLIDVVRVIAWLHQCQRDRDYEGRILAAEEDFHEALVLVSESLRRAWQTLTPAEEKVLRTVRELPEQLRTKGFKRRDLKVKEASDRTVKLALKSLTDTGYLDCDGRAGPQGYTYTLARDAEKVSLSIRLRPAPDSQESPANNGYSTRQEPITRSRPMPDSEEGSEDYREAGNTGQNGHRPIEDGDLQEEQATRRTGGGKQEAIISSNGGRLTSEEDERVKRLVREGMSPEIARREVLKAGAV